MSDITPFPANYLRVRAWAHRNGYALIRTDPIAPSQSVSTCIDLAARETGVTRHDIIGQYRNKKIVLARHLAMWLARYGTHKSLPQIGREMGHRDHTTVASALERINTVRSSDPSFRALSDRLLTELTEGQDA